MLVNPFTPCFSGKLLSPSVFRLRPFFICLLSFMLLAAPCLPASFNMAFAAEQKQQKTKKTTSKAKKSQKTPEQLKKEIEAENLKAAERKKDMTKLTDLERSVNANLAKAEDSIEKMQAKIDDQEKELAKLETAQGINRRQYDDLITKRSKTEANLAKLIRFLWPIYVGQESAGARDGMAWAEAERDYLWTAEIMHQIIDRQNELKEEESAISDSLARRETLAVQLRSQLEQINKDKDKLLSDKLRFRQELGKIRKEIKDTETELKSVLATIQSLNIRLEKASVPPPPPPQKDTAAPQPSQSPDSKGADIKSTDNKATDIKNTDNRGKKSWPASGRIVAKYAPGATPPVNGIGMALNKGTVISAVAWGKVVHNDILRGLGRVVVLMHDNGYYTVYAYLADSSLRIGQQIKQGQTIGRAGYYPPAKGTGTYFEVRFHQKAVNPSTWLAKN